MTRRWALPLLFCAFVLFYLLPLPFHGLWIPDETRYAQMSQEMLMSGNWAVPHFMGLRYFEKPAAGYWMIAIGQALFGENLFGARIASAVSLGLSVVLTYLISQRLWNDPRKSFICAAIYISFGLIVGQAGYANLDPQFTLWVNLSFVALWFAIDSTGFGPRLASWIVLGVACGMGFMTKGFLALALPVLVALPYMIWQRRFAELVRFGIVAVVVAVAISLPWGLTVHARESDFWNFFFWHEHIRRFAGENAQHARPWWFYLPMLVVSSLPWALLLPGTFKQAWHSRRDPKILFLLLWMLLPLALFSMSKGKLPTYIMPCMLPLALMIGHALLQRLDQGNIRALRNNALLNLAIGILALVALAYLQLKRPVYLNEPLNLALVIIALGAWTLSNFLAFIKPSRMWLAPVPGMLVALALVPAALPNSVVYNKTPDAFIAVHARELAQSHSLLSNDLGAASALAWHTKNPQVALLNTVGEVKYGLSYPDATARKVDTEAVAQWMVDARQKGSVGVVMRVKGEEEEREVQLLPKDGKRYEQGNIVILIFDQSAP
ncbi:lipid IV(A) 4-amino-4-deoxy-L-arabinosyltransferase [Pseudomonas akapageensis]|uniref:lipid IV(A) 4-amino-4-deoxy-L-arabinosyltransferase n=1 Tax=Pseudomonas akapageensis TaxID=2609961 RepID=UPI00140ABADC|nr:lipid IV(A) 4-amino-4-deoxy-L-arabinosyltransferase [Pseudomonas akapageensis]